MSYPGQQNLFCHLFATANDKKHQRRWRTSTICQHVNHIPRFLAIFPLHPSDMRTSQNLFLQKSGDQPANFILPTLISPPLSIFPRGFQKWGKGKSRLEMDDDWGYTHLWKPHFDLFFPTVWLPRLWPSQLSAPHRHIAQLQPRLLNAGRRQRHLGRRSTVATADVFAETLDGDQLHLHVLGISSQS